MSNENRTKKKILLIMADAHMHTIKFGPISKSLREAPLTLTTLAAMVDYSKFDIRLVDESIDDIPTDYKPDIVGISILTGTAYRGYKIAKHFREQGIPVVLGGPHVTVLPEEAKEHADSIVIGMAENSWAIVLEDFLAGDLQARYDDDDKSKSTILRVPQPRVDLQRRSGYTVPNTVQATRGCKHRCDFCSVTALYSKVYQRPIGDIIRDIKAQKGSRLVFNDVSLVDDVEYAKELFTALKPLKKTWGGLATIEVAQNDELLDIMRDSGCQYLLIGFESFNQKSLKQIGKGFNKIKFYKEAMENLHARDISIQGTMVFGFDDDDTDVFKETVERAEELRIDIPRYSIYTPYPGTSLYKRLEKEKRIISKSWEDYDTMHVVYQPLGMSVDELYDGFKWAYKESFQVRNIMKRLELKPNFNSVINLVGNMTYKLFIHRLYNDPRFEFPNGYVDERPVIRTPH